MFTIQDVFTQRNEYLQNEWFGKRMEKRQVKLPILILILCTLAKVVDDQCYQSTCQDRVVCKGLCK